MKSLTEEQQDIMYLKRRRYRVTIDELATILNCKKDHMIASQMGEEVPKEVHEAVVTWIECA